MRRPHERRSGMLGGKALAPLGNESPVPEWAVTFITAKIRRPRKSGAQGDAPVAEGLRDMRAAPRIDTFEIGERAGDAQHAVVAAGGELELLGGVGQQLAARGIGCGRL